MINVLRGACALTAVASLTALAAFHHEPADTGRALVDSTQGSAVPANAPVHACGPACSPAADVPANIRHAVDQAVIASLSPVHQGMIQSLTSRPAPERPVLSACFAPGTKAEVMEAFNAAIFGFEPRFNQASRWNGTALDPAGGGQGNPTTLTYSFVPDGTVLPFGANGAGEPEMNSNLFADMLTMYPNVATWQAHYHAIFARWSVLSGINYVYEPNDDGAPMPDGIGVAGVRGDLRMGGHTIDGNSGILAYNYYPQAGDMVIDTGDNYYETLTGNSLRLRNILAHEHGHGMGQAHVCPIAQSKLMEPFISTAYDGPQHDDIRNAQQHYGDPNEPDNTAATATVVGAVAAGVPLTLGTVPAPAVTNGSLLSIDVNGEQDYFRFSITGPRLATVTVTPIGLNYEDTPQACSGMSGSCCVGEFTNSLTQADLNVQIIASNGVTVLGTGAGQPVGVADVAADVALPSAGDYYIRVYEGNTPAEVQLYTLTISVTDAPLAISLPSGAPDLLAPGAAAAFPVTITPGSSTVVPGSPTLHYRTGAGAFTATPLVSNGGTSYTANLPAFGCVANPQFYVSAQASGGAGTVTNPTGAPTALYSATVGTASPLFSDSFETGLPWVVTNSAGLTAGGWVRVDPVGTAAQPEDDVTTNPGALCFVTGQGAVGGAVGAADIDGGSTTLTSPPFNAVGLIDATIGYWRWYSNTAGAAPAADVFIVALSNNGTTWTTVETVGPASQNAGGWIYSEFDLSDFPAVAKTATMRIRFVAEDAGSGSVVEAAVDDVVITGLTCTDVGGCGSADFDGDGDFGTDLDIEAFFACLGGNCCATCGSADFDGDGDFGTDLDIEAFFRVVGGGAC